MGSKSAAPETTTFQELLDTEVIEIGDGYRAKNDELTGGGEIFLRAGHVTDSHIEFDGVEHFAPELTEKVTSKMSKIGDTIITTKGNSTGRTSFVTEQMPRFVYSPHLCYWRSKNSQKLLNGFIRYWARGREFQNQLASLKGATDMAPYLSLTDQKRLKITVPSIGIQKSIAHILGTLDDKIELNRKMNVTLESMSRALFKSWFVDFDPVLDKALAAGNPIPEPLSARAETRRALAGQTQPLPAHIQKLFPDAFMFDEDMRWIPEGWKTKELKEVVETIIDHRGKTPKKLGGDWVDTGYPAISAKNVKNGRLVRHDTIRFVNEELYAQWMKTPLQIGDVALTSEAPLGETYYFLDRTDFVLSQRLFAIRADNANLTGCFLNHWLKSEQGQAALENRATGTTVTGIRQSELLKVELLCPSFDIAREFSQIADAHLLQVARNEEQTQTLTKLRDTLLPQLLSGSLRIPDAEQLVADSL